MWFSVTDKDKLSPVLKAIPLAYLHVKIDRKDSEYERGERFTHSSQTLEGMYNYKSFWDMENGHKRALPLSEECWFSLPRAMRPSEWYKDIFHGNKLLQYNRVFMARDILKLSANFIFFDMHQENVDNILDEYLRVAEGEPIKDLKVPPAVVPHQFKTKKAPPPAPPVTHVQLANVGLEPHQYPETKRFSRQPEDHSNLNDTRGESIHDPKSYFPVQQSVPTQRTFGFFLHSSISFDMATYCCTQHHGEGYKDPHELLRDNTPSPSQIPPDTDDHPKFPDMSSLANQELDEEDSDGFADFTDDVQVLPAPEVHGKPSAAPTAAPALAVAAPASVQGPAPASVTALAAPVRVQASTVAVPVGAKVTSLAGTASIPTTPGTAVVAKPASAIPAAPPRVQHPTLSVPAATKASAPAGTAAIPAPAVTAPPATAPALAAAASVATPADIPTREQFPGLAVVALAAQRGHQQILILKKLNQQVPLPRQLHCLLLLLLLE